MPHSYTNLLYHLVFATKDRQPPLDPKIGTRLHPYLGGAIRQEGGVAILINGMPDHVHILARLRQDKALSDILRNVKANSSKWIHQTFSTHKSFAWQTGYGAFTVSESQAEKVRRYIQDQKIHHRKTTFEQEFIALLKANHIAFDAKYLWT